MPGLYVHFIISCLLPSALPSTRDDACEMMKPAGSQSRDKSPRARPPVVVSEGSNGNLPGHNTANDRNEPHTRLRSQCATKPPLCEAPPPPPPLHTTHTVAPSAPPLHHHSSECITPHPEFCPPCIRPCFPPSCIARRSNVSSILNSPPPCSPFAPFSLPPPPYPLPPTGTSSRAGTTSSATSAGPPSPAK
jgi:hypothetical protein